MIMWQEVGGMTQCAFKQVRSSMPENPRGLVTSSAINFGRRAQHWRSSALPCSCLRRAPSVAVPGTSAGVLRVAAGFLVRVPLILPTVTIEVATSCVCCPFVLDNWKWSHGRQPYVAWQCHLRSAAKVHCPEGARAALSYRFYSTLLVPACACSCCQIENVTAREHILIVLPSRFSESAFARQPFSYHRGAQPPPLSM